jgi:hypothetical protein
MSSLLLYSLRMVSDLIATNFHICPVALCFPEAMWSLGILIVLEDSTSCSLNEISHFRIRRGIKNILECNLVQPSEVAVADAYSLYGVTGKFLPKTRIFNVLNYRCNVICNDNHGTRWLTNILSSDFNLTPTTLHGVSHLTSLLNEQESTPHGMVVIGVFSIKVVSNPVDSDVCGGTEVD